MTSERQGRKICDQCPVMKEFVGIAGRITPRGSSGGVLTQLTTECTVYSNRGHPKATLAGQGHYLRLGPKGEKGRVFSRNAFETKGIPPRKCPGLRPHGSAVISSKLEKPFPLRLRFQQMKHELNLAVARGIFALFKHRHDTR